MIGQLAGGGCISGKRVFYAKRLAERAVSRAAARGELGPMKHYPCPYCGWWHLATKRGRYRSNVEIVI